MQLAPTSLPVGPDPAQLTRRVQDMIAAGRVHAARPLMAALRRLAPPSPELHDMEARLLLRGVGANRKRCGGELHRRLLLSVGWSAEFRQ